MTHDNLVGSDDPCQTAGPVLDGEGGPDRLVRAGLRRLKLGVLGWGRRRELPPEMLFTCTARDARSPATTGGSDRPRSKPTGPRGIRELLTRQRGVLVF